MIYALPATISHHYHQPSRLPDDRLFNSLTEQFLRQCGLGAGMRVLNIGCGAGDVALLAAQLVGPTGRVLGIDGDARAVAKARRSAATARSANIDLVVADSASFEPPAPADALIGRFALAAIADPATTLRRLSRFVRPGGVIAFQEICLGSTEPVALSAATALRQRPEGGSRWAERAVETGSQLFTLFLRAGLPAPHMRLGAWADVDFGAAIEEAPLPALVGAWARVPNVERKT